MLILFDQHQLMNTKTNDLMLEMQGLIAIAYLPHGTMLLDPTRPDLPDGVTAIRSDCMKISEKITSLKPDLILLLTPHGINISDTFTIYQPGIENCVAHGTAKWNESWDDYQVEVELDESASKDLYIHLRQTIPEVHGMLAFGGLSTPLRWGEVVPLYFALHDLKSRDSMNTASIKRLSIQGRPKVVIIAHPSRGVTGR